jgi:hypothetical protein
MSKYFKIKHIVIIEKTNQEQNSTLHYTQNKIEHLGQRNHIKFVSKYLQNIIKV